MEWGAKKPCVPRAPSSATSTKMSPLSEPQEGLEQTFTDGYTQGQPVSQPPPQVSMPAGTVYGDNPYGLGNSVTLPPEQPSATPPAAPERKVVKKVVRRRKGASRAASPAPTQTGSVAVEALPGRGTPIGRPPHRGERVDTVEGDDLPPRATFSC